MSTRNTRTRIVTLLSVMLAFAVMMSAAPAFAAQSMVVGTPGSAASKDMGKVSLFVYDADSATKRGAHDSGPAENLRIRASDCRHGFDSY